MVDGDGGAIYDNGSLWVSNSQLTGNTGYDGGGLFEDDFDVSGGDVIGLDEVDAVGDGDDARHHGTGRHDSDPFRCAAGLDGDEAGAEAARQSDVDLLQIAFEHGADVVGRSGDAVECDF